MNKIFFFYFVLTTYSLNILLTTEDSWVTKNVRSLYSSLSEKHNVLLIAPLRHVPNQGSNLFISNEEYLNEFDGGDFNHLLYSNQLYYEKLNYINDASSAKHNGAKNVIHQSNLESTKLQKGKQYKNYGQDPKDSKIWYIDASPIMTLVTAMDVIIPQYYPDFKPDLIISGPKEGSTVGVLEQLKSGSYSQMILGLIKGVSSLSISTIDNQHVYYQDEYNVKRYAKALQQQNGIINKLIDNIIKNKKDEANDEFNFLPNQIGLVVNIPNLNPLKLFQKQCSSPQFKQSITSSVSDIPQVNFIKHYEKLNYVGEKYDLIEEKINDNKDIKTDFNLYYNYGDSEIETEIKSEKDILNNCDVSVLIRHLTKGDLKPDQFDLNYLI